MRKRVLSILLALTFVMGLLPIHAQAAPTMVTNAASLSTALTGSGDGAVVQLGADISFSTTITVSSALMLDLNGYTLTFTGTGNSITGIRFSGRGTFTLISSRAGGKIVATQGANILLRNSNIGTIDLGAIELVASSTGEFSRCIHNDGGGTVNLSGATLRADTYIAVYNESGSRLNVRSGAIATNSFAGIYNYGTATVSGGSVSCVNNLAIANIGSAATLTVSGGSVTGTNSNAIQNNSGGAIFVTGGTISSNRAALYNNASCTATLSGGTLTSSSSTAVINEAGATLTIQNGAGISSPAQIGVGNDGNLSMTGGTITSKSNALQSSAAAGNSVTISGGTLTSTDSTCVVNSRGGSLTISGTAAFSSPGNFVWLWNVGAGTVTVNGGIIPAYGTASNSGSGKLVINHGTYALAENEGAGSIVINGGSVKSVTGASPVNSSGAALSRYGMILTGVAQDTAVGESELTFNQVVNAAVFSGVKTDGNSGVYLWLPTAALNTARYQSGGIDISGNIAPGTRDSKLPNQSLRITVKEDGQTMTNAGAIKICLSTSSTSTMSGIVYPDGKVPVNGVFTYSSLDMSKTYYIWAQELGFYTKVATVTPSMSSYDVDFYTVTTRAGDGVASTGLSSYGPQLKGSTITLKATMNEHYVLDKWVYTTGGGTLDSATVTVNGPLDVTALAKLDTYSATVTLQKDGAAWSGSGIAVTISPSNTDAMASGFKLVSTETSGVYSFANLDPRVTYYIWTDGSCTGQAVTSTGKNASVDYYTITVTAGTNITSVTGGGVFRKGATATLGAVVATGDYVFSRWQNTTTGALLSTVIGYSFPVNDTANLTAMGGATKYDATVSLKKDGANWTASPRNIVLSTSAASLEGTVTGAFSGNTYTFARLLGTANYFVWDKDTVTYTGVEISATDAARTLEYFTVSESHDGNVTSVSGAGVYLKGSTVTLTAVPAEYYLIAGWTNNTHTISNLSSAQAVTATSAIAYFAGTVTAQKDGAAWPGSTAVMALSTDAANAAAGAVTGSLVSGVTTFTGLDPRTTYYIWADGVNTGRTVTRVIKAAAVDYYTVAVTGENTAVTGAGTYLKGSDVTLTATANGGYYFLGWYSGSALLGSNASYTVSNIAAAQTLVAKSSNVYSATVTLNGATTRDIKLSTSSAVLTGAISGSASGGIYTFSGLSLDTTYYVFDGGSYTGKSVTRISPAASLQYYTVTLIPGVNIASVSGGGTYLAGSTVTVSASAAATFGFSKWSDGSTQNPYSLTNLSSDISLTANAAITFDGTLDIQNGAILIEDDLSNSGKIRIIQNGSVVTNGNNLEPFTNINLVNTGGNTGNYIQITATLGVYLTLNNMGSFTATGNDGSASFLHIKDAAGAVTLNLAGTTNITDSSGKAIIYANGSKPLVIQSSTGTGNLGMTAIPCISGKDVIINSGSITVNSSSNNTDLCNAVTLTLNGGSLVAPNPSLRYIHNLTVYGGNFKGFLSSKAAINGGNVEIAGAFTTSLVINGGNITFTDDIYGQQPKNKNGDLVYKTTFDTGAATGTAVSGLVIRDKNGALYGLNDVKTLDGGKVYAYLPVTTAAANYNGTGYAAFVKTDGSGVFVGEKYTVNMPTPAAANGVTASGPHQQVVAEYASGVTVTVPITFAGTATLPGTYTVTLTGTNITGTTQTLTVTAGQSVNDSTKSLTFTMPGAAVSDLRISLTFVEKAKHTVRYVDGTTPLSSAVYYEGESYTLRATDDLTKTGYTVAGWNKGGSPVSGTQTMGTTDVTLTARWTANAYKVRLHSNYSTDSTQDLAFTYDTAQALIPAPAITRTGYVLTGWATSANGAKVYELNQSVKNLTEVKDDVFHLYAVWTPAAYSVTFANGGGSGTMSPQFFLNGVSQELWANTFTRTGYTFTGWKDASSSTYVNGQEITISADKTLTAQWSANHYTVAFQGNGATGGSMTPQSFTYGTAATLTANALTRTGFTFAGWDTAEAGNGTRYTNQQSVNSLTATDGGTVTLYAIWTPNSYKVTFNNNSGSGTMADESFTYDAPKALSANTFTRAGFAFSCWTTAENGSGDVYRDEESVENLTATANGTVNLYAQWTPDNYRLTFHANGGQGIMEPQDFVYGDGDSVGECLFTKMGYTFTGWNTKANGAGTSYAANATLSTFGESLTLYAQWRANSYTVTFQGNGATGGTMASQNFTYGTAATLPPNALSRGATYSFGGWNTEPAGFGTQYVDGQAVSNLTSQPGDSVTLYAMWQASGYYVFFEGNGATGEMLPQLLQKDAAAVELKANTFTRTGYTFAGWNTRFDGSGVFYTDGQSVTNLFDEQGDGMRLYAQWTQAQRYNLWGVINDGSSTPLPGADLVLKQGSAVIARTTAGADGGYLFTNLLSGAYNLAATYNGVTVTVLVMVSGNTQQNVSIPSAVSGHNSILVVDSEPNVTPIRVVVGGLEAVAEQETADITMTVTAKAEDETDTAQLAIQTLAGAKAECVYLDMTLMEGDAPLTETTTPLEIAIPFNFASKTDIAVYRYHEGAAAPLTKLSAKPDATYADGTYFLDSAHGLIYVYASQFSTYGLTFVQIGSPAAGGGGGVSGYTVSLASSGASGGSLRADKTTAAEGEAVTITVTTDGICKLTSLTVVGADGSAIAYTAQGGDQYRFTMPAGAVTVTAVFGGSKLPFIDVPETHWAYNHIVWVYEKSLMNGIGDGTMFGPELTTTRGMIVTVLWRLEGRPLAAAANSFADVAKGSYYEEAVSWAAELEIVKGYGNGSFGPGDHITREQFAAIFCRYAEYKGYDTSVQADLGAFTDAGSISSWARTEMKWAVAAGLISGRTATTLNPNATATRAECAAILHRFRESMEE